ncbi:DUF4752 family protein [Cronobacter sp. EKM101R]|uniref:DUF4752 family protein n=1 Tax=unclassified Cronobacter TaxID=2649764 RepID=UPI0013EB3F6D|nr:MULTISPECIES: DUF4752 family protein [unclassified Cronobacter]KAF6596659.1 DUF4752 family protein [Cronobacter sp. EKM101R]KAF6599485.1 DUF4752 family protein [Cronobacter sp. EKM102R]
MEAFKNFSIADWFLLATIMLSWLYVITKVFRTIGCTMLRRRWRWWKRKDEKALAMDSFYEAFRLDKLEPGETLTAKTESGLVIQAHRPKVVKDA